MSEKIKIMIADDHILMREGIRQLLEFDGNVEIIAEASSGIECLEKVFSINPDILLLDINMPEKNGLDVLREIKKTDLNIKTLILTVHNELEYLMSALDSGADGYIMKDSEFSELKRAIFLIMKGEKYIQPSLLPELNLRLANRNNDKEKLIDLTKREKEILIKVANGLSNKEIATNLSISERTVKNHIFNLFKKIGVSDRTQAAVFAIKNSLIKLY